VRTFERRIMSFNIQPVCPAGTSHIGNSGQQQPSTAGTGPGSLQALAPLSHGTSGLPRVYCLTVRGTAFLWHQVCLEHLPWLMPCLVLAVHAAQCFCGLLLLQTVTCFAHRCAVW
jgi:hypothetical protein